MERAAATKFVLEKSEVLIYPDSGDCRKNAGLEVSSRLWFGAATRLDGAECRALRRLLPQRNAYVAVAVTP